MVWHQAGDGQGDVTYPLSCRQGADPFSKRVLKKRCSHPPARDAPFTGLRSRIVQTLNVPQGYASGLHSLRPCLEGLFWNTLTGCLGLLPELFRGLSHGTVSILWATRMRLISHESSRTAVR